MNQIKRIPMLYLDESTFNMIGNGFFAIHKVKNVTSAETLDYLKEAVVKGLDTSKVLEDKKFVLKIGHGGSLDKTATGVLAVGICNGCKVLPHLLNGSKSYTVTGQLGIATDTFNEVGTITTKAPFDHVTQDLFRKTLKIFEGRIMQTPPVYSALKKDGERLADIVRRGDTVEVKSRSVTCYRITCTDFNPPYFTLNVNCGKGFYIRSLVHDLGKAVGSAAHVTSLLRTKHGPFSLEECLKPEDFTLQNIITWIKLAKKQHWKLTRQLVNYWSRQKQE